MDFRFNFLISTFELLMVFLNTAYLPFFNFAVKAVFYFKTRVRLINTVFRMIRAF